MSNGMDGQGGGAGRGTAAWSAEMMGGGEGLAPRELGAGAGHEADLREVRTEPGRDQDSFDVARRRPARRRTPRSTC